MKKLLLLSLLILLSGCGGGKFEEHRCVKGEMFTFWVEEKGLFFYTLKVIAPKSSVIFGREVKLNIGVADRSLKKIACP